MLRWTLIILGSLIAIVLLIALVGWVIPREHVAGAELRLNQNPDTVWSVVWDVESYPDWWSYISAAEMRRAADGGTHYVMRDRHGQEVPYELIESHPPRRLVMRIADDDLPFGGSWTYEVEPADAGSLVRITENGTIENPFFRFMARFVFGYHATIESYLEALASHFAEEPRLTRVKT
jgi:uncharacterized protein YndB with AHSA1/START domain